MYVPSIESLMNVLKFKKDVFEKNGEVVIPAALLKMLLQIALATADFDEEEYLKENPDVAKAVESGELESGLMHYIGFGYFEGRAGGGPKVDEAWYLKKYPDITKAIRDGRIKSAQQHFHNAGGGEGRAPSRAYEQDATQWRVALKSGQP
jgi:hypothetical protein